MSLCAKLCFGWGSRESGAGHQLPLPGSAVDCLPLDLSFLIYTMELITIPPSRAVGRVRVSLVLGARGDSVKVVVAVTVPPSQVSV